MTPAAGPLAWRRWGTRYIPRATTSIARTLLAGVRASPLLRAGPRPPAAADAALPSWEGHLLPVRQQSTRHRGCVGGSAHGTDGLAALPTVRLHPRRVTNRPHARQTDQVGSNRHGLVPKGVYAY